MGINLDHQGAVPALDTPPLNHMTTIKSWRGNRLEMSRCHLFTPPSVSSGSIIMYGALLLFESEFLHIVAISFTSLILTELLMVALTIQTWHWLMIVGELLSLACYVASLVFLHEFIGTRAPNPHTPQAPPPSVQQAADIRKAKGDTVLSERKCQQPCWLPVERRERRRVW